MSTVYDLVIVGGGPAGLMAAKVAGENGLNVALLERKESVTAVQRSCATMFAIEDDYYFGERMYFNEVQKRLVFPVTGFSVPYNGPYKNFYSWHVYTSDAKHYIRLGDYEKNQDMGSKGRLSVTYSKVELLNTLLKDAVASKVEIHTGANVVSHNRNKEFNETITAEGKTFRSLFTIAADGINSRMMKLLDLNRHRSFYGTLQGVSYYMTGLSHPHPEAIIFPQVFHKKTGYPLMIWIEPSPYGNDEYWVYMGGPSHPDIDYKQELDRCISEGPFSSWFAGAELKRFNAHVANIWSPSPVAFKDNVLIAGDAGWTVEAECTGSMMCGLKASHAVSKALRDGKPNEEGVAEYIQWWTKHFPGSTDYREFLTIMSSGFVGEENATYLYKLVNETLPCSLNPYNLFKSVNACIMKNMERIQKEKPAIISKMQMLASMPIEEQMKGIALTGYPNY